MWIGCLEAFLLKIDFRSESLVRKIPVDSGTMQQSSTPEHAVFSRLLLQRRVESPIALILATGREPSRFQIWKYYYLISADVQAALFIIWQMAHKLVRHESKARVLAARIDEESMDCSPESFPVEQGGATESAKPEIRNGCRPANWSQRSECQTPRAEQAQTQNQNRAM